MFSEGWDNSQHFFHIWEGKVPLAPPPKKKKKKISLDIVNQQGDLSFKIVFNKKTVE